MDLIHGSNFVLAGGAGPRLDGLLGVCGDQLLFSTAAIQYQLVSAYNYSLVSLPFFTGNLFSMSTDWGGHFGYVFGHCFLYCTLVSFTDPLNFHGHSMEFPWKIHGHSIEIPWNSHGQSIKVP